MLRIRTLGDIREGDLYIQVNGKDYRVFPNMEVNGNLCYGGIIEHPEKVYEVIVRVEKYGLVLDSYDIGVQQSLTEFREAEYINVNHYIPEEEPRMVWQNEYCAPMGTFEGQTYMRASKEEAAKGLIHLQKVYNFMLNEEGYSEVDKQWMKLAIQVAKEFAEPYDTMTKGCDE